MMRERIDRFQEFLKENLEHYRSLPDFSSDGYYRGKADAYESILELSKKVFEELPYPYDRESDRWDKPIHVDFPEPKIKYYKNGKIYDRPK